MGASNSRLEEDKGLQLCRARKKFIKQALNGRCSLASAHIAYVEELKIVGTALRRFVDNDHRVDSFAFARSEISETRVLAEKPLSQSSLSSRSLSHANNTNISPSPSHTVSVTTQYESHRMNFKGMFSRKVEEKPPENVNVTVSVSSHTPPLSTTPRSIDAQEMMTTPRSIEAQEIMTTPRSVEAFENPSVTEETAPWDYFGLFHPLDDQFSTQENKGFGLGSEYSDETRRNHKVDESVNGDPADAEEQKLSSHEIDESEVSEDEFDEPSLSNLVRSFNNVNRNNEKSKYDDPRSPLEDSEIRELESSPKNVKEIKDNHVTEDMVSETKALNRNVHKSAELSPLRSASSRFVHVNEVKITPVKQNEVEDKVVPKDFITSVKDIEQLFIKASGSGIEVPRMLEANKFHFRPIIPGRERESITSSLLRSCFSCGQDPSEVPPEPPQNSVKYLTWHRTTSSRSASSRNLLGTTNTSTDCNEEPSNNLFDNFCMVSGSHASTLDRLYAWEKKLYDEVKAGQLLRTHFDQKCKLLRHKESRGEKTDKTRAIVKDLHSRIRVAIHRIDSISKKIEEIRDKELQPQLEELIEGFRKMWEMMLECHQLQFHIISISQTPTRAIITLQTDSHRQITIHLENELGSLSSTFTKWISAQKIYLEAIDKWLFKCVSLQQNTNTKRNKRMRPPSIRNMGPPIYMLCGTWLAKIDELPSKAVVDSIKDLASEVAGFLPRQEKNHGKSGNNGFNNTGDVGNNMLGDEDLWDVRPRLDRFRTSFAGFLGQLNNFAESSVKMFGELQSAVEEAKSSYEQFKSQQ